MFLIRLPFSVLSAGCIACLVLTAGCDGSSAPGGPAIDDPSGAGGSQLGDVGTQLGSGGALGAGAMLDGGGLAMDVEGGRDEPVIDAGTADSQDGTEQPRPQCLKDGSQVVLLGDSYIDWVSHTFPADLNAEAGQQFRMYAVGGYSMGSGGIGAIPPQLDEAIADDPDITTVVMTGGGNDVLVPDTMRFPRGGDCKMTLMAPSISDCQEIVDVALDAADEMMNAGIAHLAVDTAQVVYFFYPNVPDGTLIGGTYPNAILDYAAPRVKDFCDSAFERTEGRVACHFVDLRPVFAGHPEYFALTDIHPNMAGSAAMAKAIWQKMKDECIAQPQGSACCQP